MTVRLHGPLDVLGAVPYLIGFHPHDSLVVLGVRDMALRVAGRADLPRDPSGVVASALGLRTMLQEHGVDALIIVGYGRDELVRLALPVLAKPLDLPTEVIEALRVEDGRYWSYLCSNPRCCSPEGTPFDARATFTAAEATVAGLTALPDRAAYEAQVEPVTGPARTAAQLATGQARARLDEVVQRSRDVPRRLRLEGARALTQAHQLVAQARPLDDPLVAWLAVLVSHTRVRDKAWYEVGHSPERLRLSWAVWLEVLRRAEPELVPAPACLFALAAWRRGEVLLARRALERALTAAPSYPMARLLLDVIEQGHPASVLNAVDPTQSSTVEVKRRPGPRPRRRSSSRRAGSPPA
jgi:hypothetical protein